MGRASKPVTSRALPVPAALWPRARWWALGIGAGLAVGVAAAVDPVVAAVIALMLALVFMGSLRVAGVVPAVLVVAALFERVVPSSIALLALFVVLAELVLGRSRILFKSPLPWVCAYVLWAVASLLWTVSRDGSVSSLWALAFGISYLLVFATLISSRADLRLVLYIVVLASFAVGSYAILGYADGTQVRSLGGTLDANTFALHQLMALPLVLVAAAHARTRGVRIAIYLAAFVVIGSIFTSLSRGTIVALAVVVLAMMLPPTGTVFRSRAQRVMIPLFVIAAGVLSSALLSNAFLERWKVTVDGEAAGSGRVNLWRAGVTAVEQSPAVGIGYGAFYPTANELMRSTPGVDLARFPLVRPGLRAHNTFLSTAAELGFVGLTLLLGLLVATALALRRTARAARDAGQHLVSGAAYALLLTLAGWAINSLFIAAENTFLLWMVVGLSLALPKLMRGERRASDMGPAPRLDRTLVEPG